MKKYNLPKEFTSQISSKYNIPEDVFISFINKLLEKNLAWIRLEKEWLYPSMGDDQKSNPMLDAMFRIEHNKGIIIFIPLNGR